VVAHALEFVRDVVEGQQVAQVTRDRLLRRDRHRDQPRDPALGLVDDRVALDHIERERSVVRDECAARLADRGLHQGAHAQDGVPDQRFLAVERLARRLHGRPRAAGLGIGHESIDLGMDPSLPGPPRFVHRSVTYQPNRPET